MMSFLCELVSFGGVFQGLPGMLLSGLMIFLTVVRRGNTVCVRGEIVELRGSLVHVFWHMFVVSPGLSNRDIQTRIAS